MFMLLLEAFIETTNISKMYFKVNIICNIMWQLDLIANHYYLNSNIIYLYKHIV